MAPKQRGSRKGSGKAGPYGSQYRFTVGTKVLCKTGADEWSAGVIVQLNYTEERFMGQVMPYQVQLFDGNLIFVPADIVQLCRLLVPAWWEEKVFEGKAQSWFAKNPSAKVLRDAHHAMKKDVNEADYQGETALMRAAQFNWQNGVEQLLQLGADVNLVTPKNKHALHFAVVHGPVLTKILIDAKANLNCQEDDPDFDPEFTSTTFGNRVCHRTPLQIATLLGDMATTQCLLDAGAEIDVCDAKCKTALHLAIEEKNIELVVHLLSHKADVNLGNQQSGMMNTPLMDAAHAGDLPIVKILLSAHPNINQQGKQDMSALHLATRKGQAKIVELLLDSGADVNQKSQCGSVEDLARTNGNSELLKVLGLDVKVPQPGVLIEKDLNVQNVGELSAAQRALLFLD